MTPRVSALSLDSEIQLEGSFFSRRMNISLYVRVSSGMDNIRSDLYIFVDTLGYPPA